MSNVSVPKVSIVMPVYNASSFLREAVDGILSQTFKDFELIAVNDGSTDQSEEILKSYQDPRIVVYSQANGGVAKALNKGIELARGEYIWRHDSDDISLATKLEKELKVLEDNPDIALCACQVAFMTERSKPAWDFKQPSNEYFEGKIFQVVTPAQFNPYCPITHGTVLVRTHVMKSLGGYRSHFLTSEDIDMWLRLIEKYKAVVLSECLSLHRLNKTSATARHGWKNKYFKQLAFKFHEQRLINNSDDLQNGIVEDWTQVDPSKFQGSSDNFNTLLHYRLPLAKNARDFSEVREIVRSLLKANSSFQTIKAILIHLLPASLVNTFVKLKKPFK